MATPMIEPNIKNAMIARLLQQGSDSSPVQHWTQGAARLAQALSGGAHMAEQEREGKEATSEMFRLWQSQQGGQPSMPQPSMPAAPQSPAPQGSPAARVGESFAALQPPAPQAPPQMAGPSPASIRFNNPGAQYPGPSANAFGTTGTATIGGGHKIAQFPDPVSGAAAQFHLLGRVYAGMPLSQAIAKWSGGNSSPQYTASVARAAGLTPDTVITPDLLRSPQGVAMVQAMAKHEAGRDYPLSPEQWQQAQTMAFTGQPAPQQMPQGMGGPAAQPPQQMAQAPQGDPRAGMIQQMINHPNPRVRAMGAQMMQQQMMKEPKDQVVGDQFIRTNPDGSVRVLYDATKATDDERNLKSENASRAKQGLKPLSMTEFKGANAAATAQGTQQGEAAAMIPAAESRANRALQGVDEIRNHPGRLHGISSNAAGLLQGTPQYDFKKRVDQLKGGAFLEAFQMLKGGGAVTEAEGNKASIAMERMDRALSKKDFDAALDDYQAAVRDGMAKLKLKARGESNMATSPQAQSAPQESRTLGNKTYVKINGQWFEQ